MNKMDISDALNGVDMQLVEAAAPEKAREALGENAPTIAKRKLGSTVKHLCGAVAGAFRKHKFLRIAVPVLALLALAVILDGTLHIRSGLVMKAYALGEAEHPERSRFAEDLQKAGEAKGSGIPLADFFTRSMVEILGGAETEGNHANRLYSPLNSYMALAMLAECTGGESRAEILQLLGVDSIEALRKQASSIYLANSLYTHEAKSVLANSLWLDKRLSYHEDTVKTLADTYFASSFRGEMGSEGYDKALQTWIKEATDGLLDSRYTDGVSLTPNTVAAIVSAMNLDVKWDGFKKNDSHPGTFNAPDGKRDVTYMYQDIESTTYVLGDSFQAVRVKMGGGMSMWLILPNGGSGGFTPEELLRNETYSTFVRTLIRKEYRAGWGEIGEGLAWKPVKVHLTLPRFDITAENDLKENFRRLGLIKTLSETEADFSGLTDMPAYLREFRQASRLIANEEGVRAVSFTLGAPSTKAALPDEVALIFNRPFLFLLTSADDLPLYAGIVNQP